MVCASSDEHRYSESWQRTLEQVVTVVTRHYVLSGVMVGKTRFQPPRISHQKARISHQGARISHQPETRTRHVSPKATTVLRFATRTSPTPETVDTFETRRRHASPKAMTVLSFTTRTSGDC